MTEQNIINALTEIEAAASPAVAAAVGGVTIALLLIGLAAFTFVWYKFSRNMARIAADKGYPERRWFHYNFWLGLPGILMVCAMPDKNRK